MMVNLHIEGWDEEYKYMAQAFRVGPFAVHRNTRNPELYTVSHIPTGTAIPFEHCCKASAVALAKRLLKALPNVWDFHQSELPEAARPAIAIVKSWKCPRGCKSTGPGV